MGGFGSGQPQGVAPSLVTPRLLADPQGRRCACLDLVVSDPEWRGGGEVGLKEFLNFIAASVQEDRSAVGNGEDRVVNSAQMLAWGQQSAGVTGWWWAQRGDLYTLCSESKQTRLMRGKSSMCFLESMGFKVTAGFKRAGTYAPLGPVLVDLWQIPTHYCKAIILQIKINLKKKKMLQL